MILVIQWSKPSMVNADADVRAMLVKQMKDAVEVAKRELKEEVQRKLARYGVAVRDASIVSFAKTKVISLIGGGTYVDSYEED